MKMPSFAKRKGKRPKDYKMLFLCPSGVGDSRFLGAQCATALSGRKYDPVRFSIKIGGEGFRLRKVAGLDRGVFLRSKGVILDDAEGGVRPKDFEDADAVVVASCLRPRADFSQMPPLLEHLKRVEGFDEKTFERVVGRHLKRKSIIMDRAIYPRIINDRESIISLLKRDK
jgi:hypothetical protein